MKIKPSVISTQYRNHYIVRDAILFCKYGMIISIFPLKAGADYIIADSLYAILTLPAAQIL